MASLTAIRAEIESLPLLRAGSFQIDASGISDMDTAAAMTLLRGLSNASVSIDDLDLSTFSQRDLQILRLARDAISTADEIVVASEISDPDSLGIVARLGASTLSVIHAVRDTLEFIGAIGVEVFQLFKSPKHFRSKELVVQIERAGLDAVPISCLVTFLIGIVIAYLSGVQLEYYGANVFIVDGISLAMCRELSPILVAIIVAGRSGSAFTAQIGAMKLNQEVDAMTTLGFSPLRILVLPRILALMLVMPALVFLGDCAGILGGMFIGSSRLGVTSATFIERLHVVLPLRHVFVGMVKAPVFAFFIGTIACRLGLTVASNAKSLGENTTKTVVRSIVAVILLNAAFAVLLSELGI
jgi:phospholipid/cholesterol/gamma-HCH transport system permease protein